MIKIQNKIVSAYHVVYVNRGVDKMANAINVFKKCYLNFTKLLPMIINELVANFYSNGYLSGDHKSRIDSLPTDEEKTAYFLDKVIKPGLETKYTQQFDEMLRIMKTSDDCAIGNLVQEVQKIYPISITLLGQGGPLLKGMSILYVCHTATKYPRGNSKLYGFQETQLAS